MFIAREQIRKEIAADTRRKVAMSIAGICLGITAAIGADIGIGAYISHKANVTSANLTKNLLPESAKIERESGHNQQVSGNTPKMTLRSNSRPLAGGTSIENEGNWLERNTLPLGILASITIIGAAGAAGRASTDYKRKQQDPDCYRYDDLVEIDSYNQVPPAIAEAAYSATRWAVLYFKAGQIQRGLERPEQVDSQFTANRTEARAEALRQEAILRHPTNAAHLSALLGAGEEPDAARAIVLTYAAA